MSGKIKRRDFLKLGAAGTGMVVGSRVTAGAAPLFRSPREEFSTPPIKTVRMGIVGVGSRVTKLLKIFTNLEGVEVRALCDTVEEKVTRAQKIVMDSGQPKPQGYSKDEHDFKRLCDREDLDLVMTATPWEWHVPVCVAAMKRGKHAFTEVPAAVTIDECWQMVEVSEKTRKHCVMLENVCYGRPEMMVLNMVRQGVFGELLHGEAGYLHDLRRGKVTLREGNKIRWRAMHSIKRDGNVYPTHGLGPVAQCMNINRGDQFDYLVSVSCKSRGLNVCAEREFGPEHPMAKMKFALGDVNTSIIRTKNGLSITLGHDCNTPRPYSRVNMVQGTLGLFSGYPDRVYIDGISPPHEWEPAEKYFGKYEHPLWLKLSKQAEGSGHGGMDYMECFRLIQSLREGSPMDMDVYDAAAWSVMSELSEISVSRNGRPVDVPDFTRGRWKTRAPLGIIGG